METIKDIFASIKTYLSERLTNPIYGAFVVSWAIINFRLVLVFIGNGTWKEKIAYIDTQLFIHWWHWALYGYLIPLATAIGYMVLSPIVNRYVTVYLRKQERLTVEALLIEENATPIPKPQADQLRKGLLAERTARLTEQQEASEKMAEQTRQIDALLAENKALRESTTIKYPENNKNTVNADSLKDHYAELSTKEEHFPLKAVDFVGVTEKIVAAAVARGLSDSQASALHAFSEGEFLSAEDLMKKLQSDNRKARVLIDQLRGLQFIEYEEAAGERKYYGISSIGTQALDAVMKRGFTPITF